MFMATSVYGVRYTKYFNAKQFLAFDNFHMFNLHCILLSNAECFRQY